MSDKRYIFIYFVERPDRNIEFHIEKEEKEKFAIHYRNADLDDKGIWVLSDVSEMSNTEINRGGLSKIRRLTESIWKLGLVEKMHE